MTDNVSIWQCNVEFMQVMYIEILTEQPHARWRQLTAVGLVFGVRAGSPRVHGRDEGRYDRVSGQDGPL